jgi:predicted hydrocarbon binding protein
MAPERFSDVWVKNLVDSLDAHLDEAARRQVMETCGRACARRGAVQAAEACQGDLNQLISTLQKWVGAEQVTQAGAVVRVTYLKCFCGLVAEGPARLPDTYCYCSCGWLKEMFETVVQHPVEVKLLESVKRGGTACRFMVQL